MKTKSTRKQLIEAIEKELEEDLFWGVILKKLNQEEIQFIKEMLYRVAVNFKTKGVNN